MIDNFAIQNWNTQVDYMVQHIGGGAWCAYTGAIQRRCVNHLHSNTATVMAKSEVHTTSMNPLNTNYSQVRYKDPVDNVWKLFDSQRIWGADFPYDTEKFSNYHFRAYRVGTQEVYLPIVIK